MQNIFKSEKIFFLVELGGPVLLKSKPITEFNIVGNE